MFYDEHGFYQFDPASIEHWIRQPWAKSTKFGKPSYHFDPQNLDVWVEEGRIQRQEWDEVRRYVSQTMFELANSKDVVGLDTLLSVLSEVETGS